MLWGCAGVTVQGPSTDSESDRAPVLTSAQLHRLSRLPDPQVVPLKPSATGNGPEYVVWGQRYRVQPTAQGYREDGIASWYGVKFHGRRTSSGEPFDMYQLTAAHRSLPIPVYARVTNLSNGRQTIVKINDRGPFHDNRIIDLSYAAAVKLDFHEAGTARVRVEALSEAQSQVVADSNRGNSTPQGYFDVGQFASAELARGAALTLLAVETLPVQVFARSEGGYGLRLGPMQSLNSRERLRALLIALDIGLPTLVHER
ncbi:MAG: septal ring lytic transglycosylase RlpA family protein [Proteobacteria bacterium]|nr:septal ring lytic transglycosylase RlpA family protein [Pseudomonadota bacterium]